MVTIVSSVQDDFRYYDNLAYLRKEVKDGNIQFQGFVENYDTQFEFIKSRIYDFTRSAKAEVREDMTTHLCDMLPPGLDCGRIREAFDCIFDYYKYKDYLSTVGQQRAESMKMLIFNPDNPDQKYVAQVQFSSNTIRTDRNEFTVHITLTCQRFTPYFAPRDTAFQDVLQGLQNLNV